MNKIIGASWERVNLFLETEKKVNEAILKDESGNEFVLPIRNNKIMINITNLSHGEMIEMGRYTLLTDGEEVFVDSLLIKQADLYTKVFKYRKIYSLIIEIGMDEETSVFFIDAEYVMKNEKYKKNFRICEGEGISDKIKVLVKIHFPFFINIYYNFLGLVKPKSKDKILFLSENDAEPRGNLKALYEYFITNSLGNTKGMFYNKFEKKSIFTMVKSINRIAFSDVIVVDNYVPILNSLNIRKNQRIVQLWHAGVGFKSVGYARFGENGSPHPFKSSHRKYTTAIIDEERILDVYKEVFALGDEVFKPLGMPRLDGYLSNEKINSVTENLFNLNPDLKNKKVILFSPTYRGIGASVAYYDYTKLDLKQIYDFCKENNFVFLVKMHPFIIEPITIPSEYNDLIIDYSELDINDLIYIADIMITDYSSCAYEFSFFNRPLVFYRYDKDFYEYIRPVHTLDTFTEEQYEVTSFNDLIITLKALKNVDVTNRFSNMRERNNECCSKIAKEILGEDI